MEKWFTLVLFIGLFGTFICDVAQHQHRPANADVLKPKNMESQRVEKAAPEGPPEPLRKPETDALAKGDPNSRQKRQGGHPPLMNGKAQQMKVHRRQRFVLATLDPFMEKVVGEEDPDEYKNADEKMKGEMRVKPLCDDEPKQQTTESQGQKSASADEAKS
ncbi:hypothetical protein niasHS_016900 [Heterodera schachtii]|uniref:Uncharacterized protein n=2 Tax=Heterodera TaxID=34509 RepID=A0ABD2I325_HETSC